MVNKLLVTSFDHLTQHGNTKGKVTNLDNTENSSFPNKETEKYILYLNRQWAVLDGIREYRTKAMVVTGTLNLGITGFTLNSGSIPENIAQRASIVGALLLLTFLGTALLFAVQLQYNHHLTKIWALYDTLGIKGAEFHGTEVDKRDKAVPLFIIGYVAIVFIGLLCAVSVIISPIKSP